MALKDTGGIELEGPIIIHALFHITRTNSE